MINLAIEVAAKAHRHQVRKGTDVPYISHPFAVAVLLLQAGCRDEVVVAAILHDTVEDTTLTLEDIYTQFGEKVAAIVEGCSEPDKSQSWEVRKEHTLHYLRTAPWEVRIVSCADKLHNIQTIAHTYDKVGDEVWKRFSRGKEKQEWYYRGLVESLSAADGGIKDTPIFLQFKETVERIFGHFQSARGSTY